MKLKPGMRVRILPSYKKYGMNQEDINISNIYTIENYYNKEATNFPGWSIKEINEQYLYSFKFREEDLKVVNEVYCI